MDHSQTWAEALNIKPEALSRWSADAPAGQPVLVYCLEKGFVDWSTYLAWASDAFGLATLDTRYFTDACDVELVRGARELESYSPWFFPVGRWDDVTYVACVEAPNADDAPPGYCFLLADPRAMRQAWDAAGVGEVTSMTNVSIGREGETIVTDQPQGFHAGETKLFTLNLDGVSLNLHGHLAPPPPEPLNRGPERAPEPEAPEEIESSILIEGDESSIVLSHEDATRVTNVQLDPPPARPAKPTVPPPMVPPTFAPPAAVPTPVATTPVEGPAARTLTSPTLATAAAPTSLALPSSEAGALTRVFEHLNGTFDQSCVLRRTDDMVRLYKWGLGMTPAGQGVALDLNYPSFLRIVARTKMPYHGYLIDSPTHREFFRGLGLNELPGCVSAVPLVIDDTLWGVLLTVAGPDRQDLPSLAVVENAATQLTDALSPAWRKAA